MASLERASVDTVAVLGFGTMGHTWATALLMGGLRVRVFDPNPAAIEANRGRVAGYLGRLREKGQWAGDPGEAMGRLAFVPTEAALAETGAQVLLEVVFEDLELKCRTFERLGKAMPADVVFWSNTSCLDVEKMGVASGRPGRFVGTHGMNPVHLMPGVEVVRHALLDPEVLETTLEAMRRIGKRPFVTDNVPGFIVNNGLIAWMIHYFLMLERRQATTEDIDTALQTSLGHPQGVFLLTDRVGLNTTILVAEALYAATLDPRYKVPPYVYAMRDAGFDGFSKGRGFYDWSDHKKPRPIPFEALLQAR